MSTPASSDVMVPTILVVDDERSLLDAIAYSLRKEGWKVETSVDGVDAVNKSRTLRPDLVVLDVMLPGMDGIQVCRRIRAFSDMPVVFLSAKGEDFDRILGLEIGADDYLTKPFVMRELVARVRANLRRVAPTQTGTTSAVTDSGNRPLQYGGVVQVDDSITGSHRVGPVEIDVDGRAVRVSGKPVALKPKEFELLAYLMARPGTAVSRETLLRDVWHYSVSIDTRTVDVHIRALRRAIEENPSEPLLLETVRGHGYRFRDPAGIPLAS